jgi:hypothetical protein
MATSIPSDCKKFRAAVAPMSAFIFVAGMILVLIHNLISNGLHFDPSRLAFLSGFGLVALVFSIGYSWMISLLFPDAFSADGIYGHSFWGRRRFVRWHDIASAQTFRLGNLRWLRVYAADGNITWLALFQSRDIEFRQEIKRLAPPGSPVLNYL